MGIQQKLGLGSDAVGEKLLGSISVDHLQARQLAVDEHWNAQQVGFFIRTPNQSFEFRPAFGLQVSMCFHLALPQYPVGLLRRLLTSFSALTTFY